MRVFFFLLLVVVSAPPAWAGNISGQINDQNWWADKPAHDACYWRLGPGMHQPTSPKPTSPVRENQAVVVIERVPRQAPVQQNKQVSIHIDGLEFSPSFLVTSPHTTVNFKNLDQRTYSCSAAGPNAFQINKLEPGSSNQRRLVSTGLVQIRCYGYPFMGTQILVVDSPLSSTIDGTGKFAFKKIPAGDYQVKLFARGKWLAQKSIKVSAFGTTRVTLAQATKSVPPPVAKEKPTATKTKKAIKTPKRTKPPTPKPQTPKAQAKDSTSKPALKKPKPPADKPTPTKKSVPKPKPATAPAPAESKTKPATKVTPVKKPPIERKKKAKKKPTFEDVEPEIEIEED